MNTDGVAGEMVVAFMQIQEIPETKLTIVGQPVVNEVLRADLSNPAVEGTMNWFCGIVQVVEMLSFHFLDCKTMHQEKEAGSGSEGSAELF